MPYSLLISQTDIGAISVRDLGLGTWAMEKGGMARHRRALRRDLIDDASSARDAALQHNSTSKQGRDRR
jgi:hypothetical protein